MKKEDKSIIDLIIDLENVNRRLDRIKNDPGYIEKITEKVFRDRPKRDTRKDIEKIMTLL